MKNISVEEALFQANALREKGEIEAARALYHSVLAVSPGNLSATRGLGELGVHQKEAASSSNSSSQFIANLMTCYKNRDFNKIIHEINILIDNNICSAFLFNIYGAAKIALGDVNGSVEAFRSALKLDNNFADAYNNLGSSLKAQGRLDEALDSYRRAISLRPDFYQAHSNLGLALMQQGKFDEAAASFRRALSISPDYADAHNNLGAALKELRRLDEAVASFAEAARLKPTFATAFRNRGNALIELGRRREALECYDAAIRVDPERALFRLSRALGVLPAIAIDAAESISSIEDINDQVEQLNKWINEDESRLADLRNHIGFVQPFYIAYRQGNHKNIISRYGDIITKSAKSIEIQTKQQTEEKIKAIKFCIVSAYFHRHSVWDIIIKGVLENIDRSIFSVHLFHVGKIQDEETHWARSMCDSWLDASQDSGTEAWLLAVKALQPDIIFYPEIGMNPTAVFMAAHRLAPLQVVGWGHPITSGLETMDCFISGELLEGEGAASHYRETLITLPGTGCCTVPIETRKSISTKITNRFSDYKSPIFILPHATFKFDPVYDDLLVEIAKKIKNCSFIMIQFPGKSAQMNILFDRMRRSFENRGLDAREFIHVINHLEREEFFALLDMCDIYLDCPGFSGYTTAWQAVHRGLPIVTLEGAFMRQRLAAGLLRQIGQIDTIAGTREEYVEIAVRLGREVADASRFAERRGALKRAAPYADRRIEVVRAFEARLIEQLTLRQPWRQGGGSGGTP